MRAMRLDALHRRLNYTDSAHIPEPGPGQVQVRVKACAVCRTDLHIVDGELNGPKEDIILGHEIIGTVTKLGPEISQLKIGQRIGIPWLGWTCGRCDYCQTGQENLCPDAQFTGYTIDGGFAEMAVADARYCFPIPDVYSDIEAAPLLCAGLIGYRAYRLAGPAKKLGLYGFGAAAHLLTQIAVADRREVYAFTRDGDLASQQLAKALGACWCGSSETMPPMKLDAAIIFAPVGNLVPAALSAVRPGGGVVCAGIYMSDIPRFPYELLWGERWLRSVANLTRGDAEAFFERISELRIRPHTQAFRLEDANDALTKLRQGVVHGAAVILPGQIAF